MATYEKVDNATIRSTKTQQIVVVKDHNIDTLKSRLEQIKVEISALQTEMADINLLLAQADSLGVGGG